jgi:hypothetical protein
MQFRFRCYRTPNYERFGETGRARIIQDTTQVATMRFLGKPQPLRLSRIRRSTEG